MNNPRLPYLREKTSKLTDQPGCYLMKDKAGAIIYVGKAKNLKKRVTSYFRGQIDHPKVEKMVEHVFDYDYIVTNSEFEALVLECSLIKMHQPKYNILLKDDKGYHYIKISDETYPRITAEKQRGEGKDIYLGPYTSGLVVKESVDEANKIFGLPTCKRKFPRDFGRERPCLLFFIKQCAGLCKGRISQEAHLQTISDAKAFLKDRSGQALSHLKEEMEEAAENLNFERAALLRDRIRAVEKLKERQQVVFTTAADQDVIAFARKGGEAVAVVIKIRDNRLVDKLDYPLGEIGPLEETREEFLLRYYTEKGDIPRQIALDGEVAGAQLLREHLAGLAGRKVVITVPLAGEGKRLVDMAAQNAAELISFNTQIYGKDMAAMEELARLLGLTDPPLYIEAYDVSNLGESHMVAGMVVFENGAPAKKQYKKFSIQSIEGQNDYGAMAEVITRRLRRYTEEKASGVGFGRLPDLILLDGGKGHVGTVRPIIQSFGLDIPVFGMVKDDKHRTRAIAADGGEIALKPTLSAYRFVYRIQEEVHRFAIGYQRQKHKVSTFASSLTKVPGVGKTRAATLMRQFKTLQAIGAATVEELRMAPGINKTVAGEIYAFFHGENQTDDQSLQKPADLL